MTQNIKTHFWKILCCIATSYYSKRVLYFNSLLFENFCCLRSLKTERWKDLVCTIFQWIINGTSSSLINNGGDQWIDLLNTYIHPWIVQILERILKEFTTRNTCIVQRRGEESLFPHVPRDALWHLNLFIYLFCHVRIRMRDKPCPAWDPDFGLKPGVRSAGLNFVQQVCPGCLQLPGPSD